MYNEEAGAAECVALVCQVLSELPARTCLIAVDDGSGDATGSVLSRLASSQPTLEVITHSVNRGYGAALRTGIEAAARGGYEYVLFMDSDLTNSPHDIPRFFEAMVPGADVIKATRYRGGGMRGVPLGRRAISRAGNAVARVLFRTGISDCTNGFRALRTSVAQRLRLRETRFPVIVEELWCCVFAARGFAEVPVILTNRKSGLRSTSFAYRPAVLWAYLKYTLLAGLRVRPGARLAADPAQGDRHAR